MKITWWQRLKIRWLSRKLMRQIRRDAMRVMQEAVAYQGRVMRGEAPAVGCGQPDCAACGGLMEGEENPMNGESRAKPN